MSNLDNDIDKGLEDGANEGVRITSPEELMDGLRSIWLGANPNIDKWLRFLPEEQLRLLSERLLDKFIMIKKETVKKEVVVSWMRSVEKQLNDITTVLNEVIEKLSDKPDDNGNGNGNGSTPIDPCADCGGVGCPECQ